MEVYISNYVLSYILILNVFYEEKKIPTWFESRNYKRRNKLKILQYIIL